MSEMAQDQPNAQQERTPSEAAAGVDQPVPRGAQRQPRGGADSPDPSYAPGPAQARGDTPQQADQTEQQQTESVYTREELLAAAHAGRLDANYETVMGAMALAGTDRMTRSQLAEAVQRFRNREVP